MLHPIGNCVGGIMSFSVATKGSRAQISRSAFKTILLTTTAIAALALVQANAYADGGMGGAALGGYNANTFGGAGGTGTSGNAGSPGDNNTFYGGGGGGGGGAGGGIGGQGGAGDANTNAAGGTSGSPDGAVGDAQVGGESGGGGGGGYGGAHGTIAGGITNTGSISGENAGNGGTGGVGAGTSGGGGGGGGAGGYGTLVTGSGSSSNGGGGTISGGVGGNGGGGGDNTTNGFGGSGGAGGDGGGGLDLTVVGTIFTNSAQIIGGDGGDGGDGGIGGSVGGNGGNGGNGGVGISATGDTIINSSSIIGGNGGVGGVAGAAGYAGTGTEGTDGAGGAGIVGSDLTIINSGTISGGLGGDGTTRANAITFTGGDNKITFGNSTSGLTGNIDVTGSLTFDQSANNVTVGNVVIGTGSVAKTGTASVTLSGNNTYSGGTTISAGVLLAGSSTAFGTGGVSVAAGATLDINGQSLVIGSLSDVSGAGGTVTNADTVANNLTVGGDNTSTTFSGVIQDGVHATGLVKQGTGTFTLAGTNTYSYGTTVTGGTLAITNSNALGSGALALENGTALTLDGTGIDLTNNITVAGDPTFTVNAGNTDTISGVIADGTTAGDVVKNGDGTLTLSATNSYTGATTVDAGTLDVTGSIASSSLTTVNSGGTLIGTGTVGDVVVASGGTFAPGAAGVAGGSTTVSGTLTLGSGSNYLVAIDPAGASYANVSGTASLAGTAVAAFDTGSYAVKQYTILISAGLGGTTFDTFATTDLSPGFVASLEYTSTDVLLDLTAVLGSGGGLNTNQQNVATDLNYYFNNGGSLPSNFLTVFGLTGGNLGNALSQLSGEGATAGANGGFQMMDQFFSLMSGMSTGGMTTGGTLSFAPERPSLPPEALAYASTPEANVPAVGGWTYWGSAFGGWNRTDGNASIGSNTVKASSYGLAMGADFQYSADTVMGVALAYGRTEWDLSNSLGGGDSDALQFGVHGKMNFGPAYLSAAAGIANHWMTTERYAAGDHLKADFNAQVYSGRLETGYRFEPSLSVGLTPYAALQVQYFRSPSHTEEDLGDGGFALSYDAMSVTNTRTELGARIDHTSHLDGKLLKLGAGLAWAHDHSTNSSVTASFTSLPGSSFSVRGVSRPANSALLSGSAELKLASGWTLAANVDSEFGSGYRSYAGRGTLTYAW